MTTTPGYTVDALLQAIAELYGGGPNEILGRAAELTQVTAQSVERASPATQGKDGGEQEELPEWLDRSEREADNAGSLGDRDLRRVGAERRYPAPLGARGQDIAAAREARPDVLRCPERRVCGTEAMQRIYAEAARITRETGKPHEVDHVIPLLGETVSGLHVEYNLQILPRSANRRKCNKLLAA